MSMIRTCTNSKAQKLVEPYMTGMEVSWINRFYEKLDSYTYQQLVDYATEVNDVRMLTVIDMVGELLKPLMKG